MSNLPLLFALAWRNLWRRPRRTGVMLAAIIMGVWAMIFMNALMRGMTDQMVSNGLNTLPGQAQLQHPDYRRDPSVVNSIAKPDEQLINWLQAEPHILAWTTRVRVPAVIASARDTRGVLLIGVDPAGEQALGAGPKEIIEGRLLQGPDDRGVVIGRRLAQRLETGLGKRIVLSSQDPDNELVERGAQIVGIYTARLQASEEAYVYTGLHAAQSLLNMSDRISQLAVTGDNYRSVNVWVGGLRAAAGDTIVTLPWNELDSFLGTMLGVQDGFALIFILVIFAVLSFGLVNTLVMAVFERTREIGLMQALGMSPRLIIAQVMLESAFLLFIGLCIGCLIGVGTVLLLHDGIDLSAVAQGMEMMAMDSVLYPALYPDDVTLSAIVVMGLGLAASFLPAWRAARLDPVQAIAHQG